MFQPPARERRGEVGPDRCWEGEKEGTIFGGPIFYNREPRRGKHEISCAPGKTFPKYKIIKQHILYQLVRIQAAVVACCSAARLPEDDQVFIANMFVEKIKVSAKVWHSRQPNLIELAEHLNLTEFVRLAKEAGVDRIINHEGEMQFVSKRS